VTHPSGNIAEFLVSGGLARVVDWHAGMLSGTPGAMERLRAAERSAREKRLGLYASAAPLPGAKADGGAPGAGGSTKSAPFEGTVVRVWTGDQISVVGKEGRERRVQLSSVRGPKYVISNQHRCARR
jgi:staphylococcal nuclease domain-containing protein 1